MQLSLDKGPIAMNKFPLDLRFHVHQVKNCLRKLTFKKIDFSRVQPQRRWRGSRGDKYPLCLKFWAVEGGGGTKVPVSSKQTQISITDQVFTITTSVQPSTINLGNRNNFEEEIRTF